MPEIEIGLEGRTYPSIKGQSTRNAFVTQNKEGQSRERHKKAPHPAYCINASSYPVLLLLRQKMVQIAKTKEGVYSQS